MKNLLFLVLLFLANLFAENLDTNDTTSANQETPTFMPKVLYLSYQETPSRVLKGEIFSITIKALSTVRDSADITYKFSKYYGLKPLNRVPKRKINSNYYHDTFYFLVTSSKAKLPDITAKIKSSQASYKATTLKGSSLNVITLNPKNDFSNIVAKSFELVEYKTTSYDNKHNIIVFVATAKNCDIKSMHFKNVFKQGIESVSKNYFNPKITYYIVIDKKVENFSFSYFNLQSNKYSIINIPIIVNDDSVTTQSDLKPKDQSRERLKMYIAAGVAFVGFIFILWRKKYIYLILILIPLAYIVYIGTPSKELCIKTGSQIHLLPVHNGTIFETTQNRIFLQKEGSTKDFVKVKLQNDKIGWVENEDICSD